MTYASFLENIFKVFYQIIDNHLKIRHIAMTKKLMEFTEEMQLTHQDLLRIKGGKMDGGPGELVDDDIDMPDLSSVAPGPGELVDDDIDMPDLTMNFLANLSKI